MNKKNVLGIVACTLIMIIVIIVGGFFDFFTHGFFCDELDCNQILVEDFKECISLEQGVYELQFSPQKAHMVGFEIYLV